MPKDKTERILRYYEERLSKYGKSGKSTLLDENMRLLEIDTVSSWLKKSDRVLDLFCANGVSTLAFSKHCKSITGIDLSGAMIRTASKLLGETSPSPKNVDFRSGNVLDIGRIFSFKEFNVIVSVRGLINLPTWKMQKEAICAIASLLPKGGKFIFLEGSKNGLLTINRLRSKFSLKPLKEPWYDRHFETERLDAFMSEHFRIIKENDLSPYFLLSRVIYPKMIFPKEPDFENPYNSFARAACAYLKTDLFSSLLLCRCYTKI